MSTARSPWIIGDVDDIDPAVLRALVTTPVASAPRLAGGSVAAVFEHPSMRTRSAFGVAAAALGATPVVFTGDEVGIDRREQAEDVAEVLARHHALVGARLRRHATFERMAETFVRARVPFVNLLTDRAHPTQALADAITILERLGSLEGVVVGWIGDANNVARSLAKAAGALGAEVRIAAPAGFRFAERDLEEVRAYLERAGAGAGRVLEVSSPEEAARDADVLATDVWVSMGEDPAKRAAFEGYAITRELLHHADAEAIVLHCLPAHRGEEIEAAVLEGPQSAVFRQAEHRASAMVRLWTWLLDEVGCSVRRQW